MAQVGRAQGLLLGRLADVGLGLRDEASLAALTDEVLNRRRTPERKISTGTWRDDAHGSMQVVSGHMGLSRGRRQCRHRTAPAS